MHLLYSDADAINKCCYHGAECIFGSQQERPVVAVVNAVNRLSSRLRPTTKPVEGVGGSSDGLPISCRCRCFSNVKRRQVRHCTYELVSTLVAQCR